MMVDEVKTEQRLRWNPSNNMFLGLCREHSAHFSLEFVSMEDLEQLSEGLAQGDVHRGSEVGRSYVQLCSWPTHVILSRQLWYL